MLLPCDHWKELVEMYSASLTRQSMFFSHGITCARVTPPLTARKHKLDDCIRHMEGSHCSHCAGAINGAHLQHPLMCHPDPVGEGERSDGRRKGEAVKPFFVLGGRSEVALLKLLVNINFSRILPIFSGNQSISLVPALATDSLWPGHS